MVYHDHPVWHGIVCVCVRACMCVCVSLLCSAFTHEHCSHHAIRICFLGRVGLVWESGYEGGRCAVLALLSTGLSAINIIYVPLSGHIVWLIHYKPVHPFAENLCTLACISISVHCSCHRYYLLTIFRFGARVALALQHLFCTARKTTISTTNHCNTYYSTIATSPTMGLWRVRSEELSRVGKGFKHRYYSSNYILKSVEISARNPLYLLNMQ